MKIQPGAGQIQTWTRDMAYLGPFLLVILWRGGNFIDGERLVERFGGMVQ